MRPPLRYPPSLINDSPQARFRFRQDLELYLREAARYLGPQEFMKLAGKVVTKRRGNKPNEPLNKLLLVEWLSAKATGPVEKGKFCERFAKAYRQQSAGAVEKRLERLLTAQKRKAERKRKPKARLQRQSLLNEVQ
jgi:hypothetical protein